MEPAVEIQGLTKRFGSLTAVDDVTFAVERGEVLGFLGPNGAGKSTTMKMLTGFLTPDAGRVVVDGMDIAERPVEVKRRIGYLPEGAPLYGDMTPHAFLRFVADIRGLPRAERARRIDAVIEDVNIGGVLEQPIDTLSKGYKRRVGLAQAILHDPEVLVLDEPTDGLDPNQKHEVRALISQMAQEKAIILSTHILEEVDAVCTRAIIIARGRVVSDGTPEDLLAQAPTHNALNLTVRVGGGDAPADVLGRLPGVREVARQAEGEGRVRFLVYPADGASLVGPVSQAARDQGWEIEELFVERGRLDEVFRDVTVRAGSRS